MQALTNKIQTINMTKEISEHVFLNENWKKKNPGIQKHK